MKKLVVILALLAMTAGADARYVRLRWITGTIKSEQGRNLSLQVGDEVWRLNVDPPDSLLKSAPVGSLVDLQYSAGTSMRAMSVKKHGGPPPVTGLVISGSAGNLEIKPGGSFALDGNTRMLGAPRPGNRVTIWFKDGVAYQVKVEK